MLFTTRALKAATTMDARPATARTTHSASRFNSPADKVGGAALLTARNTSERNRAPIIDSINAILSASAMTPASTPRSTR